MNYINNRITIDTISLIHWYQPISQIDTGEILGYEALVRDEYIHELSPKDIFKQAENEGCTSALDFHLLLKAINPKVFDGNRNLFLNIFPSTLLEPWFISLWDKQISTSVPIILEISESEPIRDWKALKSVILKLKERGVQIALDDMGSEYSFFQHWLELEPDYIKLDRYYASGLAGNFLKQRVISHLIDLFDSFPTIILEGIETEEDLETAKELGIIYAQGYLLGRPSPWANL